MDSSLGKLKRTLQETCSECRTHLQLRTKSRISVIDGEEFSVDDEYKYCPACETEVDLNKNSRKHQGKKRKNWK